MGMAPIRLNLDLILDALIKVANYIVYLTPIGVFAISASAAGTMTVAEFGRLQVYFIAFILRNLKNNIHFRMSSYIFRA